MDYQYACVLDAADQYKTLVLVDPEPDGEGREQKRIQYYTLREGEQLVETAPPPIRYHAGTEGFLAPKWDARKSGWTEGLTEPEVAAWETEHPAPAPSGPSVEDLLLTMTADQEYRLTLLETGVM